MTHEKQAAMIEELLHELGDTSDEVADTLRDAGITVPNEPDACPLTKYLRNEVPGVSVWTTYCHFGEHAIENPMPVQEFIKAFDLGLAYTDLREEENHDR